MEYRPSRELIDYLTEKTAELRQGETRHWVEAREHLATNGAAPADTAVGQVVDEGAGGEYAVLVTRDERIFEFLILYDFAPGTGRETGHVSGWKEVHAEEIRRTDLGFPDLRGRAVIAARLVLDRDLRER